MTSIDTALTQSGYHATGSPDDEAGSHSASVHQNGLGRDEDAWTNHRPHNQADATEQTNLNIHRTQCYFKAKVLFSLKVISCEEWSSAFLSTLLRPQLRLIFVISDSEGFDTSLARIRLLDGIL